MAFTAILLSVVLGDLWSARSVRGLLLDGGEIEPDSQQAEGPAAVMVPAEIGPQED